MQDVQDADETRSEPGDWWGGSGQGVFSIDEEGVDAGAASDSEAGPNGQDGPMHGRRRNKGRRKERCVVYVYVYVVVVVDVVVVVVAVLFFSLSCFLC